MCVYSNFNHDLNNVSEHLYHECTFHILDKSFNIKYYNTSSFSQSSLSDWISARLWIVVVCCATGSSLPVNWRNSLSEWTSARLLIAVVCCATGSSPPVSNFLLAGCSSKRSWFLHSMGMSLRNPSPQPSSCRAWQVECFIWRLWLIIAHNFFFEVLHFGRGGGGGGDGRMNNLAAALHKLLDGHALSWMMKLSAGPLHV
jgi:hypothetical protein